MNITQRLEESCETNVPEHFQHLIETVLAEREIFLKVNKNILEIFNLENDYVICVLVTVALECGFRLERSISTNFDIRALRELNYNRKWRDTSRRLYTVDFFLPNLNNKRFVLLVVPILGNALLVNLLTIEKNIILRSTAEPMVPSQWLSPFHTSISERFNNLPLFARMVRRFFQKEKDLALNLANEPNPSFLGIPDELKRKIFKFISAKDFVHLTATCQRLFTYKKDKGVWKLFLKKDYKLESDEPYDTYIHKFSSRNRIPCNNHDFLNQIPPIMLHRTTSSTSLQDFRVL